MRFILEHGIEINGVTKPFADAVSIFYDALQSSQRLPTTPHANCGKCEFRTEDPPSAPPRSGFHECWKAAFGWSDTDFQESTVLDLWNSRSKDALIAEHVLKLSDVRRDHIKIEPGKLGLSHGQRQWMQVSGEWEGGGPFFLDRERMELAINNWQYPFHFIDFETAAVALPYFAGQRPYGQIAFQFSHHVMYQDGRVEHRSQFLHRTVGTCPNVDFLRALKLALSEQGTVFRWAAHENTILRNLRKQLLESNAPPADRDELVEFIDGLTYSNESEGAGRVVGHRCMIDLKEIADRHFFHPATDGSSSLKKVLPAVFQSSETLKSIYGQAVYGANAQLRSLNFPEPMTWWQPGNPVRDPYSLLPPIFDDVSPEELAALEFNMDAELADGLAATVAYMRLQSEVMSTGCERPNREGAVAILRARYACNGDGGASVARLVAIGKPSAPMCRLAFALPGSCLRPDRFKTAEITYSKKLRDFLSASQPPFTLQKTQPTRLDGRVLSDR